MPKKKRRTKYYELNDGSIIEAGGFGDFLVANNGSNVKRTFLACLGPVTGGRNVVEYPDGQRWEFHEIEELRTFDSSGSFIGKQKNSTIPVSQSTDFISCDFPDLDGFIKRLDLMKENVNKALRAAMYEAGKMIEQEQKRCISGETVGNRLAPRIRVGEIFSTKKGSLGISSGYQDDAFKAEADGFNPGVVGMTWEFGRPGSSSNQRRSLTMKQRRGGRIVSVRKGAIQPVPHIRRGFDNVKNRAAQTVIEAYNREIDKLSE